MATKLTILNAALITLGKDPLQTLDQSARATAALAFWDIARDEALRSHPWNFAMKRAALARVTDGPAFGYSSAYNLPTDCLRLWECSQPDYTIESGQILCNATGPLYIRYIQRIEDATKYDAIFSAALSSLIASYLAYPITQSTTQQAAQLEIYKDKIKTARFVDSQEQPSEEFEESSLITVRG